MTPQKRLYVSEHPYFITSVTAGRQPILAKNVDLLWQAFAGAKSRQGFDLIAWVFLPEHLHIMIDIGKYNISTVLQSVKLSFSLSCKRRDPNIKKIWQRSFWDHVIRDENDFNKHLNYIHYNTILSNIGWLTAPLITRIHRWKNIRIIMRRIGGAWRTVISRVNLGSNKIRGSSSPAAAGDSGPRLQIFLGRRVALLYEGSQREGKYALRWDGKSMYGNKISSGIYFYCLSVGNNTIFRKMIMSC